MNEEMLSLLIGMMICFLDGPLVVILMRSFGLLCPLTMLFTWSTLLAFRDGNASLIFKTSDVLAELLVAWAYDLGVDLLVGFLALLPEGFLVWKYLEMTFISFLDLAGRGGRGGALLIVTGDGLDTSFLGLPVGGGMRGVNLDEILFLSVLVFWSVCKASHQDT